MAEVRFTDNLDEVIDALNSATARALLEIGIAVQEHAKVNSPVRTGALRDSWAVEVDEDNNSVSIGVPLDALEGNYAKYVEAGTSKQAPQHMLRNAVEFHKQEFKGIAETQYKNA